MERFEKLLPFLAVVIFCLAVFFSHNIQQESYPDEYLIVNIRLERFSTGEDCFMYDYTKNGEPFSVFLPTPESVEVFTKRLESLGSVSWLCEDIAP